MATFQRGTEGAAIPLIEVVCTNRPVDVKATLLEAPVKATRRASKWFKVCGSRRQTRRYGCGLKTCTQNGSLVNGNMDQNLRSNSWWFNFDPYPYEAMRAIQVHAKLVVRSTGEYGGLESHTSSSRGCRGNGSLRNLLSAQNSHLEKSPRQHSRPRLAKHAQFQLPASK